MDKNTLRLTIIEQQKQFDQPKTIIQRTVPLAAIQTKKITVITGIRRSGKSTLLKQLTAHFPKYYYFNFEDERLLDFKATDFNVLYALLLELYGDKPVFFFDEIQNMYGWEKFVRRLFAAGKKVIITGSNAKLLSSELATVLTGRHIKIELYPFSFKEFLTYHQFTFQKFYDTKAMSVIMRQFKSFLKWGGFPEVIASQNPEELKQLYQDILIKDLIVRYKIKEAKAFRELALYLLSNTTSTISFNNLKKILGFKSVSTVKNYVDYLEEAYLNFSTHKFDYSLKKQLVNDRKIYSIDTGLINEVSFLFSKNSGRLLENVVFLELKRRGQTIFYHKQKQECDFILKKGNRVTSAWQVTEALEVNNREREIAGLVEAMKQYQLSSGTILTFEQEERFTVKGCKITVLPIWRWLLQ